MIWFFFYWHASDIFPCQYVWMYLLHGYVVFCCGNLSLINYLSLALFGTEYSNYCTIALISHASKVMLKILQARLQPYMNHNFPMFKLDLEKAEEPEIKLPTSAGSSKKQESSRKTSTSHLLTMPKILTVWITTNWKILDEMGIQEHLTCLLRNP